MDTPPLEPVRMSNDILVIIGILLAAACALMVIFYGASAPGVDIWGFRLPPLDADTRAEFARHARTYGRA